MPTELTELLPRNVNDVENAQRLVALGFPAVMPVLPELLVWMREFDEPVAQTLAPLLTRIGKPLTPHVRRILDGDDELWKYGILTFVAAKSPALARELTPDLLEMIVSPRNGEITEQLTHLAKSVLDNLA